MLAFLFIISSSIMFTSNIGYSGTTGYVTFPYFLKYGIAISWFLYSTIKGTIKEKGLIRRSKLKELNIYLYPVMIMSASLFIALLTNQQMEGVFLSRSISNIFCYLCIVLCAFSCVNEFGIMSLIYSFYGLILTITINLLYTIYIYGIFDVIKAVFNIFSIVGFQYDSGTVLSNIGYSLEVAEATFALGFYFIYMLFFDEDKLFKKKHLALCVIGMYLGLKRVEIVGIVIAAIVYKLYIKRGKSITKLRNITFFVIISFSFLFVFILKYYTRLISIFDVSRTRLYYALSDMYRISPFYLGKGFGFVNMWLEKIGTKDWLLSVSHSDITRIYIEFGFILFLIWLYYYCIKLPKYASRLGNSNATNIILCFVYYLLVTYLIDNTMLLFAVQFVFIVIPMGISKGYIKHRKLRI